MNLDSLSLGLSQISYSVANLTKKNYKSSVAEISHVSNSFVRKPKPCGIVHLCSIHDCFKMCVMAYYSSSGWISDYRIFEFISACAYKQKSALMMCIVLSRVDD